MLTGSDIVWGGCVPALGACATMAIVHRVTGRAASAWRTALVVGYLVGHWSLDARDLGAAALVSSETAGVAEVGSQLRPAWV